MQKTFKYRDIKQILAEVDDLIRQIDPEIIERTQSLKKLKLERERLAAAAAHWQAKPDKDADLLLPERQQLAEAREVLQAPGLDLSPAEQTLVRASVAPPRRGTFLRWGLVAVLAVLTLLAGYQWQRAVLYQK